MQGCLGVAEELVGPEAAKRVRIEADDYKTKGLHIFEVIDPVCGEDSQVLNSETWQDIEFEVALDSGSQDHVCDELDCPGYTTVAGPGSTRGQCFEMEVDGIILVSGS